MHAGALRMHLHAGHNTSRQICSQAYDGMMFREALKAGWYDLHKARDTYRAHCAEEGLHADLALRFAEARVHCHAPWCSRTQVFIDLHGIIFWVTCGHAGMLQCQQPAAGVIEEALLGSMITTQHLPAGHID